MGYETKLTYRSPQLHLAAKGVMPSSENGRHQDKYNEQESNDGNFHMT
jgi:hypothetical protein